MDSLKGPGVVPKTPTPGTPDFAAAVASHYISAAPTVRILNFFRPTATKFFIIFLRRRPATPIKFLEIATNIRQKKYPRAKTGVNATKKCGHS